MDERYFETLRQEMVKLIAAETSYLGAHLGRQALSAQVVEVMGKVPRHEFVPVELKQFSYVNSPLPIGFGKTISQPFIVALMTDLLELRDSDVVLEIGTGLGYQAAILAELAKRVYSVEIIEELAAEAKKRLGRMGYTNIEFRVANGYHGWSEGAPYDKMIVTAAPDLIPPPLLSQLKPGGKMVIPAGIPDSQQLILVEKARDGKLSTREILAVRFSQLEEDAGAAGTG